MKACKKCGTSKSLEDFYKTPGTRDGRRGDCKRCNNAANKARYDSATAVARAQAWRKANPERHRECQRRRRHTKREELRMQHFAYRFGLSVPDAQVILARQALGCAICGGEADGYDHDHTTGRHRDWLCHQCNMALGLMKDDPERLEFAADYLRIHAA